MRKKIYETIEPNSGNSKIQVIYDFVMMAAIVISMIPLALLVAIVIICFASSLYMTADLGVSTYDAVAIVMASKWKVAKFKYCRIMTDLVCVLTGCGLFLLGGGELSQIPTIAGVGTIVTAFFMDPLIEYFNVKIARPMLEKK